MDWFRKQPKHGFADGDRHQARNRTGERFYWTILSIHRKRYSEIVGLRLRTLNTGRTSVRPKLALLRLRTYRSSLEHCLQPLGKLPTQARSSSFLACSDADTGWMICSPASLWAPL